MYTCSSLITLYLRFWVFDVVIAWNFLKTLMLDSTHFKDGNIMNLLLSYPTLKTREISFCKGCRCIEITSSILKRLMLTLPSYPLVDDYDTLETFALPIPHLSISTELGDYKCRLLNVSSLVITNLTFSMGCITYYWEE